jgi:hypothetical protein
MTITTTEQDARMIVDVERLLNESKACISSKIRDGVFHITITANKVTGHGTGDTFTRAFDNAYDKWASKQ